MIVACPECAARYRVDPSRVGPEGARLRCAKCESVFHVAPAPQEEAPAPASVPTPPPAASQQEPVGREDQQPPEFDREKMVLIADSDEESAKQAATAVAGWGLEPVMVLDGVEAMLTIQRMQPRVVILDAGLTKMYGFQVCEIIKRNESLRSTKVVLVGSIHRADRYRRPPVELYGADVYLEKPDVPAGLFECLQRFGLPVSADDRGASAEESFEFAPREGVAPDPAEDSFSHSFQSPQPPSETEPVAPPPPVAPEPAASSEPTPPLEQKAPASESQDPQSQDPRLNDLRATAERLARIIVSDIILYNPDKFEEALRSGNVVEALEGDLSEGRALFQERVDPRVREEKDHLREELLRVAREKGMT